MRFWTRWFLLKLLSRPFIRAIDWTPQDARDFDLFCRTRCGMRLFELLRQIVATQTFHSVYGNSVSRMAEARGAQNVLALLHRLRVFPVEESGIANLEDEEQNAVARGANAGKKSDDWRWIGGRGAIG